MGQKARTVGYMWFMEFHNKPK